MKTENGKNPNPLSIAAGMVDPRIEDFVVEIANEPHDRLRCAIDANYLADRKEADELHEKIKELLGERNQDLLRRYADLRFDEAVTSGTAQYYLGFAAGHMLASSLRPEGGSR